MLAIIMLIAIIGDFAVPYIIARHYKGYSHKIFVMSTLGNSKSPVHIIYNVWLVILGILFLISSRLLWFKFFDISRGLSIALILLIDIFAVGAGIIAGIFKVNENKEIVTVSSKIHGIGSAIGFMLLLFASLLLSFLFFKNNDFIEGVFSIICFIFSLIFFILFVLSDKPKFKNTIIEFEGLWQRLTLFFMYLPFAYVAIKELI